MNEQSPIHHPPGESVFILGIYARNNGRHCLLESEEFLICLTIDAKLIFSRKLIFFLVGMTKKWTITWKHSESRDSKARSVKCNFVRKCKCKTAKNKRYMHVITVIFVTFTEWSVKNYLVKNVCITAGKIH
jgi:hypothetical protein